MSPTDRPNADVRQLSGMTPGEHARTRESLARVGVILRSFLLKNSPPELSPFSLPTLRALLGW